MKRLLLVLALTAAAAFAAKDDEAVSIVKSWKGSGYYMNVEDAANGLLRGFEAQGKAVQPVGWYGEVTPTGHVDVRFNFLMNNASTDMIFLYDPDEGTVVPANEWARAAVTLATTVNPGEAKSAPRPKMVAGSRRTKDDIQAEIGINSQKLQDIYEDFLNRKPEIGGKLKLTFTILASGKVANVKIAESTINYKPLEVSLFRAVGNWEFTPAADDVTITYPFVFYRKQ